MQMIWTIIGIFNNSKRIMSGDIYNLLADYCYDQYMQNGWTPTRDEMKAALNNFLTKFYEDEQQENL